MPPPECVEKRAGLGLLRLASAFRGVEREGLAVPKKSTLNDCIAPGHDGLVQLAAEHGHFGQIEPDASQTKPPSAARALVAGNVNKPEPRGPVPSARRGHPTARLNAERCALPSAARAAAVRPNEEAVPALCSADTPTPPSRFTN